MLSDQEAIKLVRENERMKTSLKQIRSFAETALMGAWRQRVYNMAAQGLLEA